MACFDYLGYAKSNGALWLGSIAYSPDLYRQLNIYIGPFGGLVAIPKQGSNRLPGLVAREPNKGLVRYGINVGYEYEFIHGFQLGSRFVADMLINEGVLEVFIGHNLSKLF